MEAHSFPKVKNVIVKRTKNGQRYLLHDKDLCGNDIYVTIPIMDNDTEKDYFRKIKEARIKLNSKKKGESLSGLLAEYAEKRQLTQNSMNAIEWSLRGFSLDNDNNIKQVQMIVKSNYKDSTIKVMLGYIRSFFKWIILSGKCEGIIDPTLEFAVKHTQSMRTRTLTEEEEEIFLRQVKRIDDLELRLMIQLAYYTGARASSIYALTPGSIKDNKVYYYNVKTRKNYDYPVPIYDKDTIEIFEMLSLRGHLFTYKLNSYQKKAWVWFVRLFGRDKRGETISLHSLRHSFATKAIRNGVSPDIVSRLLDHSSPGITLKVYAKHSQQQLEDAIDKIF